MTTLRSNATPLEQKVCSKCRLLKPVSLFFFKDKKKGTLRSRCKECHEAKTPEQLEIYKKYQRDYTKKPEVKAKSTARARALNGFSAQAFEEALAIQGLRCGICKHLFTAAEISPGIRKEKKTERRLACADHDHITKKPRGVLCAGCNKGIGYLNDSIIVLEAAIKYLRNPPLDLV